MRKRKPATYKSAGTTSATTKPDIRRVVIDAQACRYSVYHGRMLLVTVNSDSPLHPYEVEMLRTDPAKLLAPEEDSNNA